jgi:proton glutamate symport protein
VTSPTPAAPIRKRNPALVALGALVLGSALGIGVSDAAIAPRLVTWLEPIGQLWVNAIRMTVIPLVVSALIVAVSETDARAMGRMGSRAFAAFFALLSIIAAMTALLAPPIFARLTIDADAAAAVRAGVLTSTTLPTLPTFTQWLVTLIPTNAIAAAADGAMLPLVLFTLAFGLALGRVEAGRRESVVGIFRGIADAIAVLVGWILIATPVGVFALAFAVSARVGSGMIGAVGFYVIAYSGLLVLATLVVLAAVAIAAAPRFRSFLRAALPAQLVAVTTRSSMAALPAMVRAADTTLQLPKAESSFVLPLAVSTFRLNQAVSWVVMAIFAAKLYGVPLDATAVVTLAITSVLMSFSVPGIPSASLFVVAPFFVSLGIPGEAIGVLIALDLVPDIFKTLLNVTGQLGAATIISGRESTAP